MAPVFPPLPTHFPARMLAAMLCALLAVSPVEGKRYDDPGKKPGTATETNQKTKKSKESTHKKPEPASSQKHFGAATKGSRAGSHKVSSSRGSVTRRRGKKKYVSPAERRRRIARAHKIKLAFVASSELRPMAQQLATMRTPAAYTGVTAYAHAHTGEAAAAACVISGVGEKYLNGNGREARASRT